jgi:hypothetical protein
VSRQRTVRRLFTISSAISLLFFVIAGVLWVRSYWRQDILSWNRLTSRHELRPDPDISYYWYWHSWYSSDSGMAAKGCFVLDSCEYEFLSTDSFPRWEYRSPPNPWDPRAGSRSLWGRLGFRYDTGTDLFIGPYSMISVPCWIVAALLSGLPAVWVVSLLRNRSRRQAGHCRRCGYDLRASRDRCPECGTFVGEDLRRV